MTSLPGYDAWKTREPDESRYDPETVYIVHRYSPHVRAPAVLGQYLSPEQARTAATQWLAQQAILDPDYASDYWYDIVEIDLLADCTCTSRRPSRSCPIHGIDPDHARDD